MGARLFDLSGDPQRETNADRPAGPLDQYWRAPRIGDGDECARRVGEYSSDNICLQAHRMEVPSLHKLFVRENPYKLYESLAVAERYAEFTDEHARLMRKEWRETLRGYARPFYTNRVLEGLVDPATEYSAWFDGWLGSIEHAVHLLSTQPDGGPPLVGLNDLGELADLEFASAPPMPLHPFPRAEERGDGIIARQDRARGGSLLEIRQRYEAQLEIASRGPEHAAATFDMVADGREAQYGDTGPTHEKMQPYATPRLEARAAQGTNEAFEQAQRQATVERPGSRAAAASANGTKEEEEEEEEEELPFFGSFM